MIPYYGGPFGFKVLFRLHGSAIFKSLTPALFSSCIYILLHEYTGMKDDDILDHPYPMGALISAFSFLLVFRANFAYHRYWEACTAIHLMHSKWLDFATEIAAFHYQSSRYDDRKPPAFGSHPDLKSITRERQRIEEPMTKRELEDHVDDCMAKTSRNLPLRQRFFQSFRKNKSNRNARNLRASGKFISSRRRSLREPTLFNEEYDGGSTSQFTSRARHLMTQGKMMQTEDDSPPALFLEEAAHLLSLLSAMAMCTLRNDLPEAESPLIEFIPGAPWPHVDPDDYLADIRREWESSNMCYTLFRYIFGLSRTDASRTLYNAARPFRVIGNVSDAEIGMLQAARGPLSKVGLCSMWLQEFISREYQSGSTGKVAPPIISRLYQFISDGMDGYSQAKKIAYIPFPFPHAQISTLFVLVIITFIPILMLTYLTNEIFGFMLNLFTVMCFTGLHEVARELENPFQNVPNDLPLNNFQAQFNEGLMVMFFGYHPDSLWIPKDEEKDDMDSSLIIQT